MNIRKRFDKAQEWIISHLLVAALILLLLFVICELVKHLFPGNNITTSVVLISEALITAAFAGCMVDWLTGRHMTHDIMVRAHQDAFADIVNNGLPGNAIPPGAFKQTAVNAICKAYDIEDERRGFVRAAVNELGLKVDSLICEEMQIDKTYTYSKTDQGVPYLAVEEQIDAIVFNPTITTHNYSAWKQLTSGSLQGLGSEINEEFVVIRHVYRNKTEELSQYAITETQIPPDNSRSSGRIWMNVFPQVSIPSKERYRIEITRSYNIPFEEKQATFDWDTDSKVSEFKIRFQDINAKITPVLKSCSLCDSNKKHCYNCTGKKKPCRIEPGDNSATILINEWIGSRTEAEFNWEYV